MNCCDTIRSVYDLLEEGGKLDFLYMVDILHTEGSCSRERTAAQLVRRSQRHMRAIKDRITCRCFDEGSIRDGISEPRVSGKEPILPSWVPRMGKELYRNGTESDAISGSERPA